jgi:hypothetical protein
LVVCLPGDVMLAQKIALETHEKVAPSAANEFPPQTPFDRWS